MQSLVLNNYKNFKCIANKCKDTCCAGWRIDIDKYTATLYDNDIFFKNGINTLKSDKAKKTFIMDNKTARCFFLNDDGLCDIVIDKTEKYLCRVCRDYPRITRLYGDYVIYSLSLTCEAVVNQLLTSDVDVNFEVYDFINDAIYPNSNKLSSNGLVYKLNFEILKTTLMIIQSNKYKLFKKLTYLYMLYEDIEKLNKDNVYIDEQVKNLLTQYINNYNNTDIFNELDNIKFNTAIPNKATLLKSIASSIYPTLIKYKTQDKDLANKYKTFKNLFEYSDTEVLNYNKKVVDYLSKNETLIQKYLCVLMVETLFPTNFNNFELAFKYILHRILLIQVTITSLNIYSNKDITDEMLFEAIRLLAKNIENNFDKGEFVKTFVEENNINFKLYINVI